MVGYNETPNNGCLTANLRVNQFLKGFLLCDQYSLTHTQSPVSMLSPTLLSNSPTIPEVMAVLTVFVVYADQDTR